MFTSVEKNELVENLKRELFACVKKRRYKYHNIVKNLTQIKFHK
jgi:hypothetical protein